MDKIFLAMEFARLAHKGQKRKFNGADYFVHPCRVADIINDLKCCRDADMVCAAYLHDVVEDTDVTLPTIKRIFGDEVARLVDGLTHRAPKEAYPHLNRKARKKIDRDFLKKQDYKVKTIKLADVIDNVRDTKTADHDFKVLTHREATKLVEETLWDEGCIILKAIALEELERLGKEINK